MVHPVAHWASISVPMPFEQFTVLSSNYPAQFGRSSGGIIGASTRSGPRIFHGNAFEYIRNSAFDARNFFDTAKPAFHRISSAGLRRADLKDRTFFFADYEGLRQSQGITQVDTVPSQGDGMDISAPLPIAVRQVQWQWTLRLRVSQAFYPLPNGALLCPFPSCAAGTGDTAYSRSQDRRSPPENYFTTKIDHTFSAEDVLSGTYMFDSGTVRQPDELNNKRTGYDSRRQFLPCTNLTHSVLAS